MVTAISSASASALSSTATAAPVKSQIAQVQAQITSKQTALAEAADENAKSDIEKEIATLKAQLAALEAQQTQAAETTNAPAQAEASEEPAAKLLLAGESDKIGTKNFDEETPFGDRYAIV